MSPEKEIDSKVAEIIAEEVSDEDYIEPIGQAKDAGERSSTTEMSLSNEEREIIRLLEELDFRFRSYDADYLTFRRVKARYPDRSTMGRWKTARAHVRSLLGQLGEQIDEHPTIDGLMIPSRGYVELALKSSRLVYPPEVTRVFDFGSDDVACSHIEPITALPSLPFSTARDEGQTVKRVHLAGRNDDPCIEISNASPLVMLFYGRILEPGRAIPTVARAALLPTLKFDYGAPMPEDQLTKMSEEIGRAFIYGLDIRNGVRLDFRTRTPRRDTDAEWGGTTTSNRIRYPRTKLQFEVSSLFSFASQASGDPPLAFLSYYQTLEYFVPAAVRQSALKAIKRELRDPAFDEMNNDCLLRIVTAAEGSISTAESNQFRILISEYVRTSRLEEFFDHDWGNYFTRQGPIKGTEPINLKNPNQTLTNQVADRVYHIRNRIVHAKDDPKYGDARVLLPRSAESNALAPDVLLVRLLAAEAIAASQAL
jgi:hypothetical protein